MSILNPVAANNFSILMMDAAPLDTSLGGLATAAAGVAVGIGMSVLFGSFSDCSGLEAGLETEEYREGGHNTGPRTFAKWGKYPNLVLKRGVTMNPSLWDWYYQVVHGKRPPMRKNGLIILTDHGLGITAATGGATPLGLPLLDKLPIGAWWFSNGLPAKLTGPTLNGKSNEIAVETLEIAHEGLYRIGAANIPGIGEAAASLGF
jgi:phage tail-like protein